MSRDHAPGRGTPCVLRLLHRGDHPELDVVDASAGSGHSVAVSSTGVLHTWGQGYNGRLGHGNQETKPQPAEVEALFGQHITRAVAGSDFTICVTERGAAYSFGNGGNTGTMWWGRGWEGGAPCLLEPARIKELSDLRIDLLAAGSAHGAQHAHGLAVDR